MAHVEDEDDIPTSERGPRNLKVGFKGFDWWVLRPWKSFVLGVSWDHGGWHGPMGYENGWWQGWHLHLGILCFGARLEWVSKWKPDDPADPEPRKRELRRRPRRRREGGYTSAPVEGPDATP